MDANLSDGQAVANKPETHAPETHAPETRGPKAQALESHALGSHTGAEPLGDLGPQVDHAINDPLNFVKPTLPVTIVHKSDFDTCDLATLRKTFQDAADRGVKYLVTDRHDPGVLGWFHKREVTKLQGEIRKFGTAEKYLDSLSPEQRKKVLPDVKILLAREVGIYERCAKPPRSLLPFHLLRPDQDFVRTATLFQERGDKILMIVPDALADKVSAKLDRKEIASSRQALRPATAAAVVPGVVAPAASASAAALRRTAEKPTAAVSARASTTARSAGASNTARVSTAAAQPPTGKLDSADSASKLYWQKLAAMTPSGKNQTQSTNASERQEAKSIVKLAPRGMRMA